MDKIKIQRWIDRKLFDLSKEEQTPRHGIAKRIYLQINSRIAEGKFDK